MGTTSCGRVADRADDADLGARARGPACYRRTVTDAPVTEDVRAERLRAAQAKAVALFDEVEARGLIAPGTTESQASNAIRDLAGELLGIHRFWHKRIVRAGPNTLQPYRE